MILSLFKDYKPLGLFSLLAGLFVFIGLLLGIPVIAEFLETHLVTRLPTAIAAVALCGGGIMFLVCGLILDTVVKGHRRDWEIRVMESYRNSFHRGCKETG